MENLYDLVIIGSGPAGLTAAIYAQRAMLTTLVIEKSPISGGQVLNTYEVDNFPGIGMVSGMDLGTQFREHADRLGAKFQVAEVKTIQDLGDVKEIALEQGGVIMAKAVILAMGAHHSKLGVPGEEELAGMGVSYCATCDGAFFRNRTVAVIGGGDVALEDAVFLSRGCKKVYLIHRREEFRGTKILQDQVQNASNIEVIWNSTVDQIHGEDGVTSLAITNKVTKETSDLPVDGVFIAIGTAPETTVLKNLPILNDKGYVNADETGRTVIPGIFAAGDLRTKDLRQIITAASDGANAVFSVEKYLAGIQK